MSSGFSVVAIIAAYNEADIIDRVVGDLIHQGVHVYFLDDGSTDCTVATVEKHLGRGVLAIERLAPANANDAARGFDWERILLRKAQLARELDADWFIHHDADEFRESPWFGVPLLEAIRRVDALGFNAIDFASLDFWPTHDRFRAGDDVREAFTSYAVSAPYDRLQIRCWKKTADLDLASTGGHEARFPGRNVFPLRFLLRHYPIRGQAHGERKVFRERQGRFNPRERARGWHVQYDGVREGASFLRDPATLTPYDPDAVRLNLALRHRGVEALEASLRDATAAAEDHRRELEHGREELGRTQSELAGRQADLVQTQAELGRTQAELGRAETELARTRVELARTLADLSAHGARIATLNGVVDTRTAELAAARTELVARKTELATRSAEVEALRHALGQRLDEIERWRAGVADQARQLDELHRSLSWRWTAPARAAYRLISGR